MNQSLITSSPIRFTVVTVTLAAMVMSACGDEGARAGIASAPTTGMSVAGSQADASSTAAAVPTSVATSIEVPEDPPIPEWGSPGEVTMTADAIEHRATIPTEPSTLPRSADTAERVLTPDREAALPD